MARYVPTGHIVFSQQGQLMAVPFDLETLSLTGTPVRVTQPRMEAGFLEPWEWTFSEDGTLIYATAKQGVGRGREAVWVDRSGQQTELEMNRVADGDWARFSRDGAQVVYGAVDEAGNWDVYLYNLASRSNRRLTFDPALDTNPVFHPDGKRVLFSSLRDGPRHIYEIDLAGGGPVSLSEEALGVPRSFSADGATVFFNHAGDTTTREDIGALSRVDGSTTMLLSSPSAERYPSLSPDGRWLAYESDASGRSEIYVRPYPAMDSTQQLSNAGGSFPVWGSDGRQIYFHQGRALVSVAVDGGVTFGPPEVLFERSFAVQNYYFDVAPDGEHFLMLRPAVSGVLELIVVENWFEELKQLVPG